MDTPKQSRRIGATILVFDPDAAVARLICRAVEIEGHHAVNADSYGGALAYGELGQPLDLAIIGAGTERDPLGYVWARTFRQGRPMVPVVMIGDGPQPRCDPAVTAFLGKPFRVDDLIALVNKCLG